MKHLNAVLMGAFLIHILWVPSLAQESLPVTPGARVRIMARSVSKHRLVGTAVTVSRDTIQFRAKKDAALLAIPIASLERLDVRTGSKGNLANGALFGLVSGGAVGAIIGFAGGDDDESGLFTAQDKALILGGVLGGIGLVFGTAIGASMESDIWESVPLERIRVGVLPRQDGALALTASLRF